MHVLVDSGGAIVAGPCSTAHILETVGDMLQLRGEIDAGLKVYTLAGPHRVAIERNNQTITITLVPA